MMKKVRYVKDIEILKPDYEHDFMAIKAWGVAELRRLEMPFLVPRPNDLVPEDGIYELDFIVDDRSTGITDVELEVDVVFRLRNLPKWVKGVRIFGAENSDIELL